MVNQILEVTEEWMNLEVQSLGRSFLSEEAEQKEIDEIQEVKRWFDYLKEKSVIPKNFRLEAFTIPRLDSFGSDDMLVVYQEGALWIGYPLSRFTAYTNRWNKQGILDFLQTLFPYMFVIETREKDDTNGALDEELDLTNLGDWSSVHAETSETEIEENSKYDEDVFAIEEITYESTDKEFDDSDQEGDSNEGFFAEDESEDFADMQYVSELLVGINEKLSVSISTIEVCVQEAIDLMSQKKGSKKLVRLILEVEEELIDLKEQLTTPTEVEENEV